jgi:DNA-binding CsgD family transcriptional regulator
MASDGDFLHIAIHPSFDDIPERGIYPALLLIHLSHNTQCSGLMLSKALNTFKETTIMCYASGRWVGRNVFRKHGGRLIMLSYGKVVETLRDYQLLRQAAESMHRSIPSRRITYLDDELEAILARLSPRERDVLCLLGKGHGIPEIAEFLGRKSNTVDSHLRNIRGKLRFKGMAELRTMAVRIAQTGSCHVFSRYDSHICPHIDDQPVGNCPLHGDDGRLEATILA